MDSLRWLHGNLLKVINDRMDIQHSHLSGMRRARTTLPACICYCLQSMLYLFWLADGLHGQMITEIMVQQAERSFLDEDKDAADWIEIYNPLSEQVSLEGWSLSDDPDVPQKWVFPKLSMGPGALRTVFASGKDFREPDQALHTNFRLNISGEFLGLFDAAGVLQSGFEPTYPQQVAGVSYGFAHRGAVHHEAEPEFRYWVPTDDSLDASWKRLSFDDGAWTVGQGGVGFDGSRGAPLQSLVLTDIGDVMRSKNASVYLRYTFDADTENPAIRLKYYFDDGFILYLNGRRITSVHAPSTPVWNSRGNRARQDGEEWLPSWMQLDAEDGVRPGKNVIAVHALNFRHVDRDFLFRMSLDWWGALEGVAPTPGFLSQASPGAPNIRSFDRVLTPPIFEEEAGMFDQSQIVHLRHDNPQVRIYYTLDGSPPTERSVLYQEPIVLSSSAEIHARAYLDGALSSPIETRLFLAAMSETLSFSSDLPIVVVDTLRAGISASSRTPALMHVYDVQEDGRARLDQTPVFQGLSSLKVRGSSTEGRPKKAFSVEIQDVHGNDRDVSLLGMPEESDWILYAPYNFDRALMRNPLVYELSRSIGRYAVRTRFCEVYVNQRGRPLSATSYVGVYVLMEKIKRGQDRVDMDKVLQRHTALPEVSGGYMLKIDRLDPGDSGFTGGSQALAFVEPKESEVTSAQRSFLVNYLNNMNRSLRNRDYTAATPAYDRYVDEAAWIDFHILNEFTKNPDGFRLSTYMYLPRDGRLTFGPVWDFDRTMGCDDDNRAANPAGWSGVHRYGWWSQLFRNPNFEQAYIDRWQFLREGVFSTENLHAIIDRMAEELSESSERNFQKWPLLRSVSAWRTEVRQLKNWVRDRAKWMDGQYLAPPRWDTQPGPVPEDGFVRFQSDGNDLYVTMDGTDPRLPGGGVAPSAQALSSRRAVVEVDQPLRLMARSYDNGRWSGLLEGYFVLPEPASLILSEIMYHPSDAAWVNTPWREEDLEYLEIFNQGDRSIQLDGLALTQGVTFTFPSRELLPGQAVVVASNPEALRESFPQIADAILGPFAGRLANNGETLTLLDGAGRVLDEVSYEDEEPWPAAADGDGFSLVRMRSDGAEPTAWMASVESGGNPARHTTSAEILMSITRTSREALQLNFQLEAGRSYQLMATRDLSSDAWEIIQTWEVSPTSQEKTVVLDAPDAPQRFFKLVTP